MISSELVVETKESTACKQDIRQEQQLNTERVLNEIADSHSKPPEHLASMVALAKGYCEYMKYLKNGGSSGVENIVGRLELY